MKTTLALAFLAALALQALAAPILSEGLAPWEESSDSTDREKKSYYAGEAPTPCAAASQHLHGGNGGYGNGGYGVGIGGYGAGVGLSGLGHGSQLIPSIHAPQVSLGGGYGGYGYPPSIGYGYGPSHYRASNVEETPEMQQGASDNNEQMAQSESAGDKGTLMQIAPEQTGEHMSARSAYDSGYGSGVAIGSGYGSGLAIGSGYGSGLAIGNGYGSGLAIGGGVSPYGRPLGGVGFGGPSVGVFPGGLGGCGAIPLMLSCSPNLVQGHLIQTPHRHGYSGGYAYGGGAGVGPIGHGLYRASEGMMEKAAGEQNHAAAQQAAAQQAGHQASQQATAHPAMHQASVQGAQHSQPQQLKTSSSSSGHQLQQHSGIVENSESVSS